MRGESGEIVFKPYDQSQLSLLPPSLEELIPAGHQVRLVNEAVDRMQVEPLLRGYKGGGTSSYHPKMLLKVLVYGYSQQIYTSRRIAKALRENVHFMWLSGGSRPDFRTINRFRSSRLKAVIDEVFTSVVELLVEGGLVDLREYFLDGTKIEANANRYSFVWGKSVEKNKRRMQGQIKELLERIEQSNDQEERDYGERDLEELGQDREPISAERLEQKLRELEQRLREKEQKEDRKDKGLRKAVQKVREDYLPRQRRYEEQEKKLGGRNSYSKTDVDATFMRMKEDHMRNGQLKPGYNVQMGTQRQFIVGYSIHQASTDTGLLRSHLEKLERFLGRLPENVVADAGYGSEENYKYLETKPVCGYLKYNTFELEKRRRYKKDRFRVENLQYDPKEDVYTCPAGKKLSYLKTTATHSKSGFEANVRIYQCVSCEGCDLRNKCHDSATDRRIRINPDLQRLRQQARERLESEQGRYYRSRRPVEVESVFGQIKHNRQFRRFLLRGLEKVNIEYGLAAIAHNLMKWGKFTQLSPVIAC